MAEQHAQAWIVEHLYGVSDGPVRTRWGVMRLGRLYAKDADIAGYAWACLRYLTGRRSKEPTVRKRLRPAAARVRESITRELAR